MLKPSTDGVSKESTKVGFAMYVRQNPFPVKPEHATVD